MCRYSYEYGTLGFAVCTWCTGVPHTIDIPFIVKTFYQIVLVT